MTHKDIVRGLIFGVIFYATYAAASGHWGHPALIAVSAGLVVTSWWFARTSNQIDRHLQLRYRSVLAGRAGRIAFQWAVNIGLIGFLGAFSVVSFAAIDKMGGLIGAAFFVTLASQGFQYVGGALYRFGYGSEAGNVVVALAASLSLNALAVTGHPGARLAVMGACIAFSLGALGFQMLRPRPIDADV